MKHLNPSNNVGTTSEQEAAQRREVIRSVQHPEILSISGFEALSIGESINLFLKEIGGGMDRRLASLSKSVHPVEFLSVKRELEKNGILYVKNTTVQILTPEAFIPGMGNMMAYTKAVISGAYIIGSLKTEAARLYDWLKQVVSKGRMESDFKWAVSDFSMAVNKAETFLKDLPETSRSVTYNLNQVYMSFDEMWDVINTFNNAVKTIGGRDVEVLAKTWQDVYNIGQLLVRKIKASDLIIDEQTMQDIEQVVTKFSGLNNVAAAMMVLTNELSAVFAAQVETVKKLQY